MSLIISAIFISLSASAASAQDVRFLNDVDGKPLRLSTTGDHYSLDSMDETRSDSTGSVISPTRSHHNVYNAADDFAKWPAHCVVMSSFDCFVDADRDTQSENLHDFLMRFPDRMASLIAFCCRDGEIPSTRPPLWLLRRQRNASAARRIQADWRQ